MQAVLVPEGPARLDELLGVVEARRCTDPPVLRQAAPSGMSPGQSPIRVVRHPQAGSWRVTVDGSSWTVAVVAESGSCGSAKRCCS
jgi:hypothetical protein